MSQLRKIIQLISKIKKTNFKKTKLYPKKLYKFSKKILNSKLPQTLPYKTKISIIQKKKL